MSVEDNADAKNHDVADAKNDDVRAQMRAALERKQSNDRGVEHKNHPRGKGPETHGAIGAKREFRRKSG